MQMLQQYYHSQMIEAGIDEAGRGCLAGPVVAAAVILPKHFQHNLLNDSKKVSVSNRYLLRKVIEESALSFSVQFIDNQFIDKVNILQATMQAMHQCVQALSICPKLLLIDGNYFRPYPFIPHHCIIKGDSKLTCIAAASILAKTYRDEYMQKIDAEFPEYGWIANKGYGTKQHLEALQKQGVSPYHRKTFRYPQQTISKI